MKMIKEFIIKNKALAKIKILFQLLLSNKYVVIAIKKDKGKDNVTVDFQYDVTNSEMKFYTNYLCEYVTNTSSIIESANRIVNS